MALERSVTLVQAVIYGVGVILGAGIYALIGLAAGVTGTALWLSFVVAAIIASLTALSYAELASRFPKEGAESFYARKAFRHPLISFFVGFIFLLSTIFSISAVAWGFATYAKLFVPFAPAIIAGVVIIAASIINYKGIQESVTLNNIFTFIEALGLFLIIFFGFPFIGSTDLLLGPNGETGFALLPGVIGGISLVFFAFLGFEGITNISEEIKGAKKVVPKAILFSLIISTIIYVLVAMVAVSAVSPATLSQASIAGSGINSGPLALVAEVVIGEGSSFWLSVIALFATFNTVLILLIIASRYLYGLGAQKLLPAIIAKVSPHTKTPVNAIIVSAVVPLIFISLGNLEILGNLTTLAVFLLFFMVNMSLIAIRVREKQQNTYFSPLNVGKVPVLAVIGALFCAYMLFTQYWQSVTLFDFNVPLILVGAILFLCAFPLYWFFERTKIHVRIKRR